MTTLRVTSVGYAVEWFLLALCSLLLFAHTLPNAWRKLNTDFPNYYLAAQLAHEGYDTTQLYDWRWLQREKDHRGIDQRIVGLAPITPFSTLFVWPLTRMAPLQAKHWWLMLQLALLVSIGIGIRQLTDQPLRRIALITTACFPLHRNLLYGQFYILLLGMLIAACWAYRRQFSVLSGVLVAVATMTKIFPAIFLLYFLRKRDWRALAGAGVSLALCSALSVGIFGWGLHRHYLEVVLPWTLRGETLPPYLLASSSITTLLHRLFVYEPQWNSHPWRSAPMLAAVLAPLLQMFIIAPVLLLIRPGHRHDEDRLVALEWSSLLCATLAVSTIPASYNFTLLLLPMTVLWNELTARSPAKAILAVFLYLAIGFPAWNTSNVNGLRALLHEPRLMLALMLTVLCCWTMTQAIHHLHGMRRENLRWCMALCVALGISIAAAVRHQHALYADYAFRLPLQPDVLLSADPIKSGSGIETISLLPNGYRLIGSGLSSGHPGVDTSSDQLTFDSAAGADWVEEVSTLSRIHTLEETATSPIADARSPILSAEGRLLAYLQDQRGHSQLIAVDGKPLTPRSWNVLDASALADGTFLIAAAAAQGLPALFHTGSNGQPMREPEPLQLGTARYPSQSPDQRWLAFSRYESGSWNLWLLDHSDNTVRRITEGSCNHVEPSWEDDSKTLLYASDCGRALGFTAICRRKVVP